MKALEEYRKQIDKIDKEILILLGKRFSLVWQIGKQKAIERKAIRDANRERKILTRLEKIGKTHGVSKVLINTIWPKIFAHGKKLQKEDR